MATNCKMEYSCGRHRIVCGGGEDMKEWCSTALSTGEKGVK